VEKTRWRFLCDALQNPFPEPHLRQLACIEEPQKLRNLENPSGVSHLRLKKHIFRPIELKNHIFWPTELKNQIFRPLDTRLNSDPLDTRLNLHFIRKKSCFSEVHRLTPYPLDNRWTPLDPCLTPASPLKIEFLASEIEKNTFFLIEIDISRIRN
jgi:hypothetical protein